jgi:hypothetical protein
MKNRIGLKAPLLGILGGLALFPVQLAEAQDSNQADRLKACQSQRVVLLPGRISQFRVPGHEFIQKGDEGIIEAAFGKTASITAIIGPTTNPRLLVKLDGSDQSLEALPSYEGLGFSSALARAQTFVGRRLWTTGAQSFATSKAEVDDYLSGKPRGLSLKPATPLTIRAVEWGTVNVPIVFRVETGDGRMGLWPIDTSRPLDTACLFSYGAQSARPWNPETDGYLAQDPRVTFASWGQAAWKLIENGEVAVGMSQPMLTVVCGQSLERVGSILSGGASEEVWQCSSRTRRFVMRDGKVLRFE